MSRGIDEMSLMYLAKVNLTDRIFDVYEKKLNLTDVKRTMYAEINEDKKYSTTYNSKYKDAMGNLIKVVQHSKYRFKELSKIENNIITGKMVRTFNKPTEKIGGDGKVYQAFNEENVSIYFYFDCNNELIAFSERQSFGYNQFMTAFNFILNQNSEGYKFEIFLQKDTDVLQEKIRSLKTIRSIRATLIPPNSNDEDLEEFRRSLQYIQDCQETNANKLKLEMSTSDNKHSLKIESRYMQDVFKAVSRGYGDITTYGINQNGRKQKISSNQDAAFIRIIDENLGEYDYNEEAKNFILELFSKVYKGFHSLRERK